MDRGKRYLAALYCVLHVVTGRFLSDACSGKRGRKSRAPSCRYGHCPLPGCLEELSFNAPFIHAVTGPATPRPSQPGPAIGVFARRCTRRPRRHCTSWLRRRPTRRLITYPPLPGPGSAGDKPPTQRFLVPGPRLGGHPRQPPLPCRRESAGVAE